MSRPKPGELNEGMGRMITIAQSPARNKKGSQLVKELSKIKVVKQKGPKPRPRNLKAARLAEEAKKVGRVLKKTAQAGLSVPTDVISSLMGKEPTAMIKAAKALQEEVPKMKKGGAAFPDLTGDGKVTKKDILRGRGVPGFKRGGAASNVCRGGGAALRGTRFRGVK